MCADWLALFLALSRKLKRCIIALSRSTKLLFPMTFPIYPENFFQESVKWYFNTAKDQRMAVVISSSKVVYTKDQQHEED